MVLIPLDCPMNVEIANHDVNSVDQVCPRYEVTVQK